MKQIWILGLAVLAAPVGAEPRPVEPDCVAEVRAQMNSAKDAGAPMSRTQVKLAVLGCIGRHMDAVIAWQERQIETLNGEIAALNLRIDENNRILDENGKEIARIETVNGELRVRRAALQADTAAKLDEAERILQRLATQ